ncbi:hypothetical protein BVY03_01905 [bacterium K02(2017)]|nr:hypothetical protein BVY03_01905 [bacterium K02(2017)]
MIRLKQNFNFILFVTTAILILFSTSIQAEGDNPNIKKLVAEKQCLNCHKPYSSLNTPRLHGSSKDYLFKQLKSFKEGTRKNVIMRGVAQKLTEQDMELLATHFSGFNKCEVTLKEATGPGNPSEGEKLAQKCTVCHNKTNKVNAPNLDGQNGYYIANQLRSLKYGQRENKLMAGVVKDLDEQNILDLAAYFSYVNSCNKKTDNKIIYSQVNWSFPANLLTTLRMKAKEKNLELNKYIEGLLKTSTKKKLE